MLLLLLLLLGKSLCPDMTDPHYHHPQQVFISTEAVTQPSTNKQHETDRIGDPSCLQSTTNSQDSTALLVMLLLLQSYLLNSHMHRRYPEAYCNCGTTTVQSSLTGKSFH